eukprot:1011183-Prymnesium_polylepis.1
MVSLPRFEPDLVRTCPCPVSKARCPGWGRLCRHSKDDNCLRQKARAIPVELERGETLTHRVKLMDQDARPLQVE